MSATVRQLRRRDERPPEAATIAGRPPPHDLDAEAAVLSAIICEGSPALDQVRDILGPFDFYSDANRRIYEACTDLADGSGIGKGRIDVVLVATMLRDTGRMGQVGGPGYLAQIADATPAVANVRQHAMIVAVLAQRRRVIATCQRVAAEGYGPISEVTAHEDGTWFDLVREAITDDCRPIGAEDATHIGKLIPALVEQAWARADETAQDNKPAILSTGIPTVDAVTGGLHGVYYLLIGAKRGGGKSAMLTCLAVSVTAQNFRFEEAGQLRFRRRAAYILSMEMPKEKVAIRIVCTHAKVNANRILRGTASPEELTRFSLAAEEIQSRPIYIDDSKNVGPSRLRAKVRRAQAECEARGEEFAFYGIDYLQLMKARSEMLKGASREEEVSACAKSVADLASEYPGAVLVLLSQLNKSGGARESEAAEMHAGTMWRIRIRKSRTLGEPHSATIEIAKQRDGEEGLTAATWFHDKYTLFTDEERIYF